ncbi:MAG: aspartate ammonia-lyase [Candidatus Omnitrophica bacterium]|nr:aspartate ammonia-lyase [Candidatus Omnitrophota bacterium]
MEYRTEKDSLGERLVPAEVYWGIHTRRALENFVLGGPKTPLVLVYALAMVKKAAALTNCELGYLAKDKAEAIVAACDEVMSGRFNDQFPLDALQGGAGTSTNMNLNEVLANRANELLGGQKGEYALVHPLDHVNRHQSTNDVYPTALKCAAITGVCSLAGTAALLQGALQRKEQEFANIVKIGRTELQEAVPMTLGAEFSAWAEALARDRWRVFKCEERLRVVNLGGTAIGTGLGAPQDYIFLVIERLREVSGFGLARGENVLGETANADVFVEVSGILKAHAVNLIKLSNDLRLLNLLGEIHLPACQAGSSIMPGKVNPVIPEAVIQAALKVMANDALVAEAASRSALQINEFLPLLAQALLESLDLLAAADRMLAAHIEGVQADEARCRLSFEQSRMCITALVPFIGYDRAGALVKDFNAAGRSDLRAFLEENLGSELIAQAFAPQNLMSLGSRSGYGK